MVCESPSGLALGRAGCRLAAVSHRPDGQGREDDVRGDGMHRRCETDGDDRHQQIKIEPRLLYQIIAGSYERRSIIFTTNIEFSKWGTIFADDKLAAAIIDRIVHHGRLIEFTGPSRRVSQALMFGKTDNQ